MSPGSALRAAFDAAFTPAPPSPVRADLDQLVEDVYAALAQLNTPTYTSGLRYGYCVHEDHLRERARAVASLIACEWTKRAP